MTLEREGEESICKCQGDNCEPHHMPGACENKAGKVEAIAGLLCIYCAAQSPIEVLLPPLGIAEE